MRIANIIVSTMLLLLSLVFYLQTSDFPASLNAKDVGPAYYPQLIMALLAAFCILLIIQSIKKGGNGSPGTIAIPRNALWGILIAVTYAVLMPIAGYYLTTVLALLASMYVMGIKKVVPLVGTIVVFIAMVYLIFFNLLGLVPPSL